MKTLVLGIGNTLLTDEGAGIHVLDYLREKLPEPDGVTYLDGGTLSFTLAGAVEDADNLIVIDAAQLKQQPGTVDCKVDGEMDAFLGSCKRSVHEVGLLDLLDIARLTDTLPTRRALVAIQPDVIDWGEAPTDAVAAAIPQAAQHIMDLMAQWQVTGDTNDGM
ncbi:peptidase M52 [Solemya pervernicosa gill symbiont]|uniref:Peptidase M52 n=1 Tax=Solemya pervernicosa gill symbiont TaxID=642797 RepID=A0A1T2L605_9GAMM|nr:HyaD/HybD family hydrogenase maturation endopeptidase [Solemya pervernicosa gill symbiont]OOZ40484.1 peptidase M52 [Solemya pervernicosa gill symbiont]